MILLFQNDSLVMTNRDCSLVESIENGVSNDC
jgi:hypothetical protein